MSTGGRLGDVVEVESGQVDPRKPPYRDLPHVGGDNIVPHTGELVGIKTAGETGLISGKFLFDAGHVLYSKIRPALNKVLAPNFKGICSADIYALRPDAERLCREYLVHVLRSSVFRRYAERRSSRTNIPKLNRESLLEFRVPLPPLQEQRRQATLLDKADEVRRKRAESLRLVDALLRASFLDMFGDPVRNPKGWPVVRLSEIGSVRGGLQVSAARARNPVTVPYLRVANVFRDALDLRKIKSIRLTAAELQRTRLAAGDLLLVEGHGNPDEIGRAAVWDGSIDPCVHQNHLIRVTLNATRAAPAYVVAFLNSFGGRRQLLRAGKTTSGLNTISTAQVGGVALPLPPREAQDRFAATVRAARRLTSDLTRAGSDLSSLSAALADGLLRPPGADIPLHRRRQGEGGER